MLLRMRARTVARRKSNHHRGKDRGAPPGLVVGRAVAVLRPEMELESTHRRPGRLVEDATLRTIVAEFGEVALKRHDRAGRLRRAGKIGPQADAAAREPLPVEPLAGI